RVARAPADLREDVVGIGVTRVVQPAVASPALGPQACGLTTHTHRGLPALHRDVLRGQSDPDVPGAEDLLGEIREIRCRVLASTDVEPLHQYHAAERLRVGRA